MLFESIMVFSFLLTTKPMKKLTSLQRTFLILIGLGLSHNSVAHPGRLNVEGCHNNRKTGEYHCHRAAEKASTTKRSTPSDLLSEDKQSTVPLTTGTEKAIRQGDLIQLDYEGFTVWLDCSKRGPIKFRYTAQHDGGNSKRYDKFMFDPKVPPECQQTSAKAYGHGYDRGHQVPANHLDASEVAIKQSNFMTNILPQTSQMNRGAWLETEEIVECYRDIAELLVIGGVIWGNNPADDYFQQSHGVETPDAFWKVIIRGTGQDERAIAWIVPNTSQATRKNLDSYLVSIVELEKAIGEKIPVADYAKHDKPSASWLIPMGCDKS